MREIVVVVARQVAAVSLGGLSALHVLWATGSAWPAPDRATLGDAIGGFTTFPGTRACLIVAALLGTATISVAGIPQTMPRTTRLGSVIASGVLLVRGSVGLAGMMPHAKRSQAFAALDRRVYSPVCLLVATAMLVAALPDGRPR